MKRFTSRLLSWAVRPVFWVMRMTMKIPEHPAGSASGQLSASAEYLAIYEEGDPVPVVVVVMRYVSGSRPTGGMSSMSSSIPSRADHEPRALTITHNGVRIQLTHDSMGQVMQIQSQVIPLNECNLVMCELGGSDGLTLGSVRTLSASLPNFRGESRAGADLLEIADVRTFLQ